MVLAAFILNLISAILLGIVMIFNIIRLVLVIIAIVSGKINADINGNVTIQALSSGYSTNPNQEIMIRTFLATLIVALIFIVIFFVGNLLFTIFSYKIYKGRMKNSLAISILDLIFGNLISGILLIVDYGDKKEKGEVN